MKSTPYTGIHYYAIYYPASEGIDTQHNTHRGSGIGISFLFPWKITFTFWCLDNKWYYYFVLAGIYLPCNGIWKFGKFLLNVQDYGISRNQNDAQLKLLLEYKQQ